MSNNKLTKIVINKFGKYHGEIKLKGCTIINCAFLCSKEINDLSLILKFMFSKEEDLKDIEDLLIQNDDCPFVEAHIQTFTENLCIFKKSYQNRSIAYEIDGHKASSTDFKNKLQECGYLFTFTWFIAQNTITSLVNLADEARVNLIEDLCGNTELKTRYNQYEIKKKDLEFEMKYLNDHKKELYMERDIQKNRSNNAKSSKKIKRDHEKERKKSLLARFYNNDAHSKKISDNLPINEAKIKDLKQSYQNVFTKLKNRQNVATKHDKDIIEPSYKHYLTNNHVTKYERKLAWNNCELELLELHKSFCELVEKENKNIDAKLEDATKKLTDLEAIYDEDNGKIEEYKALGNQFGKENPNFLILSMIKRQIDQTKKLKDELNSCEMYKILLMDEQAAYKQQLINLKKIEEQCEKSLHQSEDKIRKWQAEFFNIKNLFDKARKMEVKTLKCSNNDLITIDDIQKGIQQHYTQFTGREKFVQVLSEAFEISDVNGMAVTKAKVLNCLGENANVITVENLAYLNEIKNDIKMLQHEKLRAKFIALDKIPELGSIDLNMCRLKIPSNIKVESIEKFFGKTDKRIVKALKYLLQASIVCDCKSLRELKNVFNSLGETTGVISFVAGCTVISESEIQIHPLRANENASEDKIIEYKSKMHSQQSNLELEKYKRLMHLNRYNYIKVMSKWLNGLLEKNGKFLQIALIPKINKYVEYLNQEQENIQNFESAYNKLLTTLNPSIENHFQSFCKKHRIQSIQEYQETIDRLTFYDNRHENVIKTIQKLRVTKQSLLKFLTVENCLTKINDTKNEGDNFRSSALTLRDEIAVLEKEEMEYNVKWKRSTNNFQNAIKEYEQIKSEYRNEVMTNYFHCNKSKLLSLQNFILLQEALTKYDEICVNDESFNSLMSVPPTTSLDQSFDFITHQICGTELDYSTLDENLEEIPNIEALICELIRNVESLKRKLNECPLYIENAELDMSDINRKINYILMEIRSTNAECQTTKLEFDKIEKKRARKFNECMEALNEEIQKCCRILLNRETLGLMPEDESLPFTGITYMWPDVQRGHTVNQNWKSAFAFLVAILNYRRQRLLPYFELSSELPLLRDLVKYSASGDKNLQPIVFWKSGVDEKLCDYTIMTCNNKIKFFNNQELQARCENF